ncbi:MAG: menaquinone biosynthesis decarboxylase [Bacteroidetes bacterium]|nr:menaquinone biosynthesis decarboxylase [Bacteroidota bacterium]
MAYKNLQAFIEVLEKHHELIRIKEYVNPHLEITEVVDRISKSSNNKALLFENTGTDFPILINSMGSEKRMCLALGVAHLDDIMKEIESLFKMLTKPKENILDKLSMLPKLSQFASWMPKVVSGKGACQEVIMMNPDLHKLPVMFCWPFDGGKFITLPVIHTKDPHNGIRNVGMYRMQIYDEKTTGMHWHKHKVSAKHFNEYKKLGKRMPVAVALGGDPVYTYAATAPLPENVDEYMLAGFLRKKKVTLVRCITQPEIEVPEDADFIIEGYIDPTEDLRIEGPFGDHTGFYSLPDLYPIFHVTCITHRTHAVYPSTIVGIPPQEDAWIGKATERIFLAPIKMTMVPEILDMNMPVEGVFHNLVLTKIEKSFAGQAQKVMNAMWGAGQMMFNKILVITDESADLNQYEAVAKHVFKHLNAATDIYFSQGPMDVLDHSCTKMGFGGKMCIDGTIKHEEEISEETYQEEMHVSVAAIQSKYPEVKGINTALLAKDIACVIISVQKQQTHHVQKLTEALHADQLMKGIKMVLIVDASSDVNDISSCLWRVCNNFDPKRDAKVLKTFNQTHQSFATIYIDGTRKTKQHDLFQRDWPNAIVSDKATILAIDKKWASLGLGTLIDSPSLKYQDTVIGESAEVRES